MGYRPDEEALGSNVVDYINNLHSFNKHEPTKFGRKSASLLHSQKRLRPSSGSRFPMLFHMPR
jgi:hypothetical protein